MCVCMSVRERKREVFSAVGVLCIRFPAGRTGKPRSYTAPSQRFAVGMYRQGLGSSVFIFFPLILMHMVLG